jgi:hypothetical protein
VGLAAALLRCGGKQLWQYITYFVGQTGALDDISKARNIGIHLTSMPHGMELPHRGTRAVGEEAFLQYRNNHCDIFHKIIYF